MRLLHVSDRSTATREHAMLRRLEIGLVDEGCRVVRLAPERALDEPTTGLAASITYPDSPWRVGLLSPLPNILRALDETDTLAADDEGRIIDAVHVWGVHAWPLALPLAGALRADLILEVLSRQALADVPTIERRTARAPVSALWLAPDDAMRSAVERVARRWPVLTSRWGVHAPPIDDAQHPIRSIAILASGGEPAPTSALLSAIAHLPADPERPQPMIFLDSRAVERNPSLWRLADGLRIHSRLSLVPDFESRRQLVLRADAFIQADCRGEHATLLLEAMAAGLPVISRADRHVEASADPAIATLVEEPSEQGWRRALETVLSTPAPARTLALAAHRYIRQHRLAHLQVKAALDAYSRFHHAGPIPLDQGR